MKHMGFNRLGFCEEKRYTYLDARGSFEGGSHFLLSQHATPYYRF